MLVAYTVSKVAWGGQCSLSPPDADKQFLTMLATAHYRTVIHSSLQMAIAMQTKESSRKEML